MFPAGYFGSVHADKLRADADLGKGTHAPHAGNFQQVGNFDLWFPDGSSLVPLTSGESSPETSPLGCPTSIDRARFLSTISRVLFVPLILRGL